MALDRSLESLLIVIRVRQLGPPVESCIDMLLRWAAELEALIAAHPEDVIACEDCERCHKLALKIPFGGCRPEPPANLPPGTPPQPLVPRAEVTRARPSGAKGRGRKRKEDDDDEWRYYRTHRIGR